MSFKLFIYYCALGGGWAAFLTWAIMRIIGLRTGNEDDATMHAKITGAILGALIAATIGTFDALANSVGFQRVLRILVCAGIGLCGGFLSSWLGVLLYAKLQHMWTLVLSWIFVGVLIGASIGIFDVIRAMMGLNDFRAPLKKTLNGIYGGFLGGFLGGLPFGLIVKADAPPAYSDLALGLVILGLCIGLFIPLAQVVLKVAWIKVEAGFRPGREIMLNKDETLIGKAEGCDIGLFGGQGLEKKHALVYLKNGRYLLTDLDTPGGTYVNDQRVTRPVALRDGDFIRVGNCVLRFGERAKR
jgi:hypothetical protein